MTLRGRNRPIILGPCPCQGCGALVVYTTGTSRTDSRTDIEAVRWRDPATRRVHECLAREIAA